MRENRNIICHFYSFLSKKIDCIEVNLSSSKRSDFFHKNNLLIQLTTISGDRRPTYFVCFQQVRFLGYHLLLFAAATTGSSSSCTVTEPDVSLTETMLSDESNYLLRCYNRTSCIFYLYIYIYMEIQSEKTLFND